MDPAQFDAMQSYFDTFFDHSHSISAFKDDRLENPNNDDSNEYFNGVTNLPNYNNIVFNSKADGEVMV